MMRISRGLGPTTAPLARDGLASTPGGQGRQPGAQILRQGERASDEGSEAAAHGQRHSHKQPSPVATPVPFWALTIMYSARYIMTPGIRGTMAIVTRPSCGTLQRRAPRAAMMPATMAPSPEAADTDPVSCMPMM